MAINPFQFSGGSGGSYGEGRAFEAAEYLKQLRAALDAGQIGVSEFLKLGQPAAQMGYEAIASSAGRGSQGANIVKPLNDQLAQLGFARDYNTGKINVNLPGQYQQKIREELLPSNLSPEEREAMMNEIPTDIGFDLDRFNIEREGIRQSLQQKKAAGEQKTLRQTRLNELAGFLAEQEGVKFQREIPEIAEQANLQGVYRSTGFGNALAKRRGELAQDTNAALASQGIADRDMDVNAISDILNTKREFQSAGLDRQFSLDDATRNFNRTLQMADLTTPKPQGKSTGEKWASGISTAGYTTGQIGGKAGKKAPTGAGGQP